MVAAGPDGILCDEPTVRQAKSLLISSNRRIATVSEVSFEERPPMKLKGKAEPLPVYAVVTAQSLGDTQSQNDSTTEDIQLPFAHAKIVGRMHERATIQQYLSQASVCMRTKQVLNSQSSRQSLGVLHVHSSSTIS